MENIKRFRIRTKSLFLTYPQYKGTLGKGDLVDFLKGKACELKIFIDKYIVAQESHEDGGIHFHVYIEFKEQISISDPTFLDFDGHHGNYQAARSPQDVVKYCTKEDADYLAFNIDVDAFIASKKSKKSYIGELLAIKRVPLQELVKENPQLIFDYQKLKRNMELYTMDTITKVDYYPRVCYWIMGLPGIGKSRYVAQKYPDAYRKAQNKWWDGYCAQEVVVLDDLDTDCLNHYLKIWADCYSFVGEVKGGSICPTYKKFFVTSNKTMEELATDNKLCQVDDSLLKALERRFIKATVRKIPGGDGRVELITSELGFLVDQN